ncbi:hypothetical protein MMC22_006142 [Lobaria immixta]|nr:hypothetical protein [Lobaria immixta]
MAGGMAGCVPFVPLALPPLPLLRVSWAIRGVTIRSNSRSDFDAPNGIWSPLSALFGGKSIFIAVILSTPFLGANGPIKLSADSYLLFFRLPYHRTQIVFGPFLVATFLRLILTCSSSAAVRA